MNSPLIFPFIISVAYLLLIMPRVRHRANRLPFATKLFAHRGFYENGTDAPENSLKAFQNAVDSGYGIELDVQLTKDKVPVVFHDEFLDRMCGCHGRICDHTLSELKELRLLDSDAGIPTLAEALRVIDGRVSIIVELKMRFRDYRLCEETDALLREYNGIYCMESFNPQALMWYRKNRPEVMRGILSDGFIHRKELRKFAIGLFLLEMLLANFVAKPDFTAYNFEYRKNPSRVLCRKLFRCASAAWTIGSEDELKKVSHAFDVFIFEGFRPEDRQSA
ncbi:MAG: glycerophosphodiester phosphodiesterase [Lachnospiraceae bacterium]|nr:glycerophosphodiester phosphodiesterase [Lachnospiraceae bacterium]